MKILIRFYPCCDAKNKSCKGNNDPISLSMGNGDPMAIGWAKYEESTFKDHYSSF